MSTMTMRSAILHSLLVLVFCAQFGLGLECYQCEYIWIHSEYPNGTVHEDEYYPGGYEVCAQQPSVPETCSFGAVCYSEVYSAESDSVPTYPGAYVTERGVRRGCSLGPWSFEERCVHHGDVLDVNVTGASYMYDPSSEICKCEEDLCNTKVYDDISAAPSVRMSTVMLITAVVAYLGF